MKSDYEISRWVTPRPAGFLKPRGSYIRLGIKMKFYYATNISSLSGLFKKVLQGFLQKYRNVGGKPLCLPSCKNGNHRGLSYKNPQNSLKNLFYFCVSFFSPIIYRDCG